MKDKRAMSPCKERYRIPSRKTYRKGEIKLLRNPKSLRHSGRQDVCNKIYSTVKSTVQGHMTALKSVIYGMKVARQDMQ